MPMRFSVTGFLRSVHILNAGPVQLRQAEGRAHLKCMVGATADIGVMLAWRLMLVHDMLPQPMAQIWMACQSEIVLLCHGHLHARKSQLRLGAGPLHHDAVLI